MAVRQYFVAGNLIDGSGGPARKKVYLAVEDGMITGLGPAVELPSPEEAQVNDLSHCCLVPALVDCSLSLNSSPSVSGIVSSPTPDSAELLARHIYYCHSHGVVAVADHGDSSTLHGLEHGAMVARRHAGQDFLRISYSPAIDDEGAAGPLLSRAELQRILSERGAKRAVVVANGEKEVAEALTASCDAIEQGYGMGEDNLRRMVELGVLWIPSVLRAKNGLDSSASGGSVCCRFSQRYVAPGQALPGAEEFWKKTLADHLKLLRLARELGVKAATGTGAGSTGILHGEAMVEEIKLFMTAGFSLEEALHCASEVGARFFDFDQLGALTVGRPATFLVSRGSVKQLPRKLGYLENIYIGGAPSPHYRKNPTK